MYKFRVLAVWSLNFKQYLLKVKFRPSLLKKDYMFHILLNTVGNSSIAYHPEVKATDKIVLNLIRYNWFLKFALLNIHFAEKWQLTVGPFKCKFKLHVYIGAAIPPNSTVVNSENHIWYLIVSLDEEKHGMGCKRAK